MKKIRNLQGKLEAGNKKRKSGRRNRTLGTKEQRGIQTKLNRAFAGLKSMCINSHQKALIEIGKSDLLTEDICKALLHSFKYIKPQSRTRYAAPAYCYCRQRFISLPFCIV